ncbi:MAG TPA: hypothetical protein VF932_13245 [Anaerolineae bacterium]
MKLIQHLWVEWVLVIWLCLAASCAVSPAATPGPALSPTPVSALPLPSKPMSSSTSASPTLPRLPTPGPGRGVAAQDVPACMGAENLDQPVRFTWAGIEEFTRDAPPENWTYYRCAQTPAAAAGFYREQLVTSPFNWQERHWFERPEGTQGVYFHQASERWVFIWFLPDPSAEQSSLLVVAWAEAHTC